MVDLSQAAFTRVARGGTIATGAPAENVVLGISSTSHAAVRRVHNESPAHARTVLSGKLRKYFLSGGWAADTARRYQECVERYIEWDSTAGPATETPSKGQPIAFNGGIVRARPDVILGDEATGDYEVRVLLWDELPLTTDAAQLIALPVVERVEATYGPDKIRVVRVIDLTIIKVEDIAAETARQRRADVEALLAGV